MPTHKKARTDIILLFHSIYKTARQHLSKAETKTPCCSLHKEKRMKDEEEREAFAADKEIPEQY